MLWFVLTFAGLVLGYWFLTRPHKYWVAKGVKQGNPGFILGDNWDTVLQKQSFTEMVQTVYNVAPNSRYSGMYQFLLPTLVLRDPELIKQITVKDFDHFLDHRTLIAEESDPLLANNLFSLTGQKWRDMRSTLSPAFTSSKMKYMFSMIALSGEQFVKHFSEKNEDVVTTEMKDTFTRFTNDVIANVIFGFECNSLMERENEFYVMGKELTIPGFWRIIKIFGYILIPKLYQIFEISFFPKKVREFFYRVVKTNIKNREQHGIVRPDMINLLLEARKYGFKQDESQPSKDAGFATVEESKIEANPKINPTQITDEDIASQALTFFFGGFDSVSALMCFMSHELAVNSQVQERLIQEVDDAWKACHGKLTYEAILTMKYMDMVVSETLRKWPPIPFGDRICTKPYTIEPQYPDEQPLHLKENDVLWIPVFGLHRDPQYYPDPERFDPERFSDENKGNIKSYAYLPFGSGPRNCLGSRFALLQTKALFFYILSHFKIIPVEKTQIPLVLSKKLFNMTAEKGFWLGFQRRYKLNTKM